MKKWFDRNKVLLITFGITTIILITLTYFQLNYILQHLNELEEYAQTGVISKPLSKFGTIGIFNIITFGIWVLMLLIILWKMLFPSKESVKNAFHINDFEFIFGLPSNIRRELKKDE